MLQFFAIKPSHMAACALLILLPFHAKAQTGDKPAPDDIKTVNACLEAETDNPRQCIGRLSTQCRDNLPGGGNTMELTACDASERLVWENMIREEIAKLSGGTLGKTKAEPANRPAVAPQKSNVMGRQLVAEMHQAWTRFAPRKCDVESLQAEGGSYGRIVYGICMMKTAGDHALWLRELREEVESH